MTWDSNTLWMAEVDEHKAVMAATAETLKPAFDQLVDLAYTTITQGGKILFLVTAAVHRIRSIWQRN